MVRVKKARRMKMRKMVNKLAVNVPYQGLGTAGGLPWGCTSHPLRLSLTPPCLRFQVMTWAQITTITVPGARIATGHPQFYHCIIFHSTCTVKWAREVCQCVCNEVPFASHPWQSTHHRSSLALDLLGNICMVTHNPCVTCQPSVMERFPYIYTRNTLRLMIHEMAPDTRRNHSWKLIELGVNMILFCCH